MSLRIYVKYHQLSGFQDTDLETGEIAGCARLSTAVCSTGVSPISSEVDVVGIFASFEYRDSMIQPKYVII